MMTDKIFCKNPTRSIAVSLVAFIPKTGHPALQSPRRNTLGSNGEWKFDFSACKRIGIAKR